MNTRPSGRAEAQQLITSRPSVSWSSLKNFLRHIKGSLTVVAGGEMSTPMTRPWLCEVHCVLNLGFLTKEKVPVEDIAGGDMSLGPLSEKAKSALNTDSVNSMAASVAWL
jgi:hypothetical protein